MNWDNVKEISLHNIESTNPLAINNFIVPDPEEVPNPDYPVDRPMLFDGIMLGMCIKGTGSIRINFKEYDLERSMILAILPNHIFKVEKSSGDFILVTLFFSFDFISGLPIPNDFDIFFNMAATPCIKVSDKDMKNLMSYHTFILKQYNKKRMHYRTEIIRGLLYALILEIGCLYKELFPYTSNKDCTRQEEITENFFSLLMKNFREERSVSFYAGKMFITAKYLSLAVKNTTGYPVLKWIDEIVITDIKSRLKMSNLTVLQISEELNFSSPSFFCRYFKKNTGMTPLEYKNSR